MHFFRPRSRSPVIQSSPQGGSTSSSNSHHHHTSGGGGSRTSSGNAPTSPFPSPGDSPHPQYSHPHHHSNSIGGSTSSLNDSQGRVHYSQSHSEGGQQEDAHSSVISVHRFHPSSPSLASEKELSSKNYHQGKDKRSQQGYGGGGEGGLPPLNSQQGKSGGTSCSRSPVPLPPMGSSTFGKGKSSVSPAPTPRYLIKGVESHVRVVAHPDSFAVSLPSTASSSYTSITWSRYNREKIEGDKEEGGGGDAGAEKREMMTKSNREGTQISEEKRDPNGSSGNGGQGTGSSSSCGKNVDEQNGPRTFQVTRVHCHSSTDIFYQKVVAPCVANSLAGQSYIFLVNGPPESGRSQTMYGVPHHKEKGIVELTAQDLLQRAEKQKEAALAAAGVAEAGGVGTTAPTTPTTPTMTTTSPGMRSGSPSPLPARSISHGSPRGADGTGMEDVKASLSGLTVTYSAFLTRGKTIIETAPIPVLVQSSDATILSNAKASEKQKSQSGVDQRVLTASPGVSASLPASSSSASPSLSSPATHDGVPTSTSATRPQASVTIQMLAKQPVPLVLFPAPLGVFPLAHMQLLESAAKSVVIPAVKHSDTSCAIQFQVYAPIDTHGTTRSFATLTFIDVTAFTAPPSREVEHLMATIRRVAGIDTSSPPDFAGTALTSILEPALTGGSVTLMNITAVSGRRDLFDPAQVALQFASDITQVQQVLLLTHLRPPRWLFEAGQSLEARIRLLREEVEAAHYEKGVHDYYKTLEKWLDKNINEEAERLADDLSRQTEAAREQVASGATEWIKDLQQRIEELTEKISRERKSLLTMEEESNYQMERLETLNRSVNAAKEKVHEAELETARRVSETRLELAQLEISDALQKQEWNQFSKSVQSYHSKIHELEDVLHRYAKDVQSACVSYRYAREFMAYKRKREDLEEELVAVSKLASQRHENWKMKRERRSKMGRLEILENNIKALRAQLA